MALQKLTSMVKDKKNDKYVTALDIGTEFVKVLIGKIDGANIEVIGVGRERQKLSDMHSGAIADIAGVVKNCDVALSQAEKMAQVDSRKTIIGIAGELVHGSTTTIKYNRNDSAKPLDETEIEQIIKKVKDRAYERAHAELKWQSGNKDLEVRLVNSSIVNIDIDGYKVNNPIGFQGKEVAIQLFTAFAPMVHIGALERTAENLDLDLLSVTAEPFAVARSVSGEDDSFNAICIDVGGGTTDIALINDGGIEGTKMFAIGGRSFTRGIATQLDIPFEKAEQLKLKYGEGNMTEHKVDKFESVMKNDIDVWLSGVELALSEFEALDHLPSKILLCGGGAGLPLIKRALETEEWRAKLAFTKVPRIEFISPEQIQHVRDTTSTIHDHTFATTMGMLQVGLDVVSSGDSEMSVMQKLNKILQV